MTELKRRLLNAAEVFDSWRVIPRLFLALTMWWCVYLTDKLIGWYIALPHAERGIEASGFASVSYTHLTLPTIYSV